MQSSCLCSGTIFKTDLCFERWLVSCPRFYDDIENWNFFKVKWVPSYEIKWWNFYSDVMRHAWKVSLMQPPVELALLEVYQWADTNSAVLLPSRWEEEQSISLAPQDKIYRHLCGKRCRQTSAMMLRRSQALNTWIVRHNSDLGICGKISRCLSSNL